MYFVFSMMKLFLVFSAAMVCWTIILVKADNWEEHQVKILDRKKVNKYNNEIFIL